MLLLLVQYCVSSKKAAGGFKDGQIFIRRDTVRNECITGTAEVKQLDTETNICALTETMSVYKQTPVNVVWYYYTEIH